MTLEEALEASGAEPVNDIFEIDPETRVITVPASEKLFGVANDGNSERKHFRCPKIVGDNIDLSTMHLYVNYQNANGDKYPYLVEDIRTDGDYITFSWLIGPDVVAYKGQIKYIVCAKNGATAEWNTTLAEGTVLEGLEATNEVVARNPDIIEQILTRLDNVTEIPQKRYQVQSRNIWQKIQSTFLKNSQTHISLHSRVQSQRNTMVLAQSQLRFQKHLVVPVAL